MDESPPPSSLQIARAASMEKRQLQRAASHNARQAGGAAAAPCPCLSAARAWLSSPANTLRLRVLSERPDEWEIECPSLATGSGAVTFGISLDLPHGITVSEEGSVLEELEADSYAVLFGDGEACEKQRQQFAAAASAAESDAGAAAAASASHDGCTVGAILAFAHAHIRRMDAGWASPNGAKSSRRAGTDMDADEFDAAGSGGGDDFDDDAGFGDDDDGEDWGDAEEVDASTLGVESSALPASAAASPARMTDVSSAAASSTDALSTTHDSSGSSSSNGVRVMALAEASQLQASMIHRVSSLLGITSSAAIVLLRSCRWNEEACVARFRSEGVRFAQEVHAAGLLREFMAPPPESSASAPFECEVCYDEVPLERTFSMRCGHRHCLPCWQNYLQSEIEGGSVTGGSALDTRCAGFQCKDALGHECVELILAHSDSPEEEAAHARLLERYEAMLVRSFIDENDSLAWCPAAGCERVLESHAKLNTVQCSCGHVFCFRCCLDAHAPCSCSEAADWMSRDKGAANLDSKFLLENTKACPNCHVRTKKEGGCMYITCRCKTSWCWHCGQDGKDHHVWECNRPKYEGGDSKGSELSRYLFYFERYYNHRESTKAAAKQLALTEDKMAKLVAEGMHWKQVDFVRHATELVIQCRRVLSWSYARAFFIQDKGLKQLFEYRQSELEQYTEKLNQLTEGSLDALTRDRLLVLDWTRALGRYLQNIQIDEHHAEKAIPAGAVTTRITKEEAAHGGKIALQGTTSPAAAAVAPAAAASDKTASPMKT